MDYKIIDDLYTHNDLIVNSYENDNHLNRFFHNHIIDAECRDETLIMHNNVRKNPREVMVVDIGSTALASMLTRLPAMLPMSGAIGTIRWINLVLSTSTSTIPRPTPTPTMARVLLRLKSIHKDNRVLRLFSITAKSGSFIGTYSFDSNKNNMRDIEKDFYITHSLAKIMAKYCPPQSGLVG